MFNYLGLTAMIRSEYNPFADPVNVPICLCTAFASYPVKIILMKIGDSINLWKITANDRI